MKTVKTYSPKTKILSLILSFLIIFYLVPSSVFAEALESDTTVLDNSVSENEENTTYTPEIYEVTELREENVKHFRLADGSYVAAQYNYPVHYTGENGEFEDIDNRLVESGSEFSTGNSRVKFIKKITGNGNIFTIHDNNTKITMGLVGAEKKTKGVVTSNHNSDDAIDDTLGKMTNLENISSTILYEDILDGVDIEYIVHSLNIKENIIVKEKKDSYSYTFTLELNNLTAILSDDDNVYINSYDGETQYVIPAPVVFDAVGAYAPDNASAYTLYEVGNGKYELIVTVNSSWMNADERAFPVVIDPPMLCTDIEALDLSIDSNYPDSNTDGDNDFYVSSSKRAYVKFDESNFADIPIGASLIKAELNLFSYKSSSSPIAKVGVYEIVTAWDSTLTWNKTLAPSSQGVFGDLIDYHSIDLGKRYSWNITELYKSWFDGAPNYGVGLKLLDENSNESVYFSSSEYTYDSDDSDWIMPVIMATYIYNDGLEDYYPTTTHSAGVGGAGSINLSTGRLTLAIPTITTTDYLFAFTPTMVYNSSLAGKAATSENVSSAFSTSYMPNGFKLNINETIIRSYYYDAESNYKTYYILYDADGSTHRFYDDPNSNTYFDDDGLRQTLTVGTDEITIEDIDHNVKTYSKINSISWYLTSIKDNFGNELVFEFGQSYRPVKIHVKPNGLDNIEMLRLLYEGNKLCAVYNDSSKDSVILRYSGDKLAMIQYCYGNTDTSEQNVRDTYNNSSNAANVTVYATATYSYDNLGNIVRITDNNSGKSLWYEITDEKITKLSEYAGSTLGQEISYSYGEGYTDVRSTGNNEILNTTDDIITRYVFDSYGRSVSAHSYYTDNQIIGATMNTYEKEGKAKNQIKESAIIYDRVENYLDKQNSYEYFSIIQGGIEKTAETGCYKRIVFEEEDPDGVLYSNANKEYIISGFGYSNSIIQNENAKFSLSVNVYYYQGAGQDDIVLTYHYDFLDVEDTWQFVSGKLDCKISNTTPSVFDVVRKIELVCNYYGQPNTGNGTPYAYFDKISFTDISNFNSYRYTYNANSGNLEMKSSYGYREYYEYNDENSIKRIANSKGEIYDYQYAEDNVTLVSEIYYTFNRQGSFSGNLLYDYPYGEENIESKITKKFINQTDYTYTEFGLLNSTFCYTAESSEKTFTSSYTYDETPQSPIFGALLTETDTLGNTTKYFYDTAKGHLLAQINLITGNGYSYGYSNAGELEYVWPAVGTASSYSEVTDAEKVDYEYDSNTHRLSRILTDATVYSFSYDPFGNSTDVKVGNNSLATYEYYPNNGKINKINYGNGFSEEYKYTSLELLDKIWYNYDDGTRALAYSYNYNTDGTLKVFTNHLDGTIIQYTYDAHGRFISSHETNSALNSHSLGYTIDTYDAEGRVAESTTYIKYLSSTGWTVQDVEKGYEYNSNGTLRKETTYYIPGNAHLAEYYYDNFNRITKTDFRADDFRLISNYSYLSSGSRTSSLIGSFTSTVGSSTTTYNYTYDSNGNITKITKGDTETTYTYDDLGQLTKEHSGRVTKSYTYDDAGNITAIQTVTTKPSTDFDYILYAAKPGLPSITTVTKTLSYTDSEWGDLLTSYDGTAITYDEIGNPLSYYNGSAYTFTWEGRQLVGAVKGGNTLTFVYNDEGIRTSKTVNGSKHTYYLVGSQIFAELWENKLAIYLYDASGAPIGMMYRTTSYSADVFDVFWFEKNLQGDIVAVYNSSGTKVATYTYSDAWGNHTVSYTNGGASTGAQYNPFRYRGYYYDKDLGMYYLKSRYYDSNTCRFISPDNAAVLTATPMALTDKNLYAYCDNNPVMRVDEDGEFWLVNVGLGILAQYLGDVVGNIIDGKTGRDILQPTSSLGEYIAAGVTSLIPGTGICGALVSNVVSEGICVVEDLILGNEVNLSNSLINIGIGTIIDTGFEIITNKVTDAISSKIPHNYSSYAHSARQKNPSLSYNQIKQNMQRSIRLNRFASDAFGFGMDVFRASLPY